MTPGGGVAVRREATADLSAAEIEQIRELLWAAFAGDEHGGMTEDDWEHAVGGAHFVAEADGAIVSHAAVVERVLEIDGRPVRTGYVEAVATQPDRQRQGFGTAVMRAVASYIAARFELGALGTGSHGFYERLGWQTWRGPTSVRTIDGRVEPTPDEDGFILVLVTPSSPTLDLGRSISCEWRPGDVW